MESHRAKRSTSLPSSVIDINVYELRDQVSKIQSLSDEEARDRAAFALHMPFKLDLTSESISLEPQDRLRAKVSMSIGLPGKSPEAGQFYELKTVTSRDGEQLQTNADLQDYLQRTVKCMPAGVIEGALKSVVRLRLNLDNGNSEDCSLIWKNTPIMEFCEGDSSVITLPRAYSEDLCAWRSRKPPGFLSLVVADMSQQLHALEILFEYTEFIGYDDGEHDKASYALQGPDVWMQGIEEAARVGTNIALEVRFRCKFPTIDTDVDCLELINGLASPMALFWAKDGRRLVSAAAIALPPQIYPAIIGDFLNLFVAAGRSPRDRVARSILQKTADKMLISKMEGRQDWENAARLLTSTPMKNGWPFFRKGVLDFTIPVGDIDIKKIVVKNEPLCRGNKKYAAEAIGTVLGGANKIAVLCGAGVSVPAGIQTFRGEGSMSSKQREIFFNSTKAADQIQWQRRMSMVYESIKESKPTLFHYWLGADNRVQAIYSFNVDGLEKKAGVNSDRVVQLHGSFLEVECQICGNTTDKPSTVKATMQGWAKQPTEYTRCERCVETISAKKRPRGAEAAASRGYYGSSVLLLEDNTRLHHETKIEQQIDELQHRMGTGGLLIVIGTSLSKQVNGGTQLLKTLMEKTHTVVYVSPDVNEEFLKARGLPFALRMEADDFIRRFM